MFQFGSDRLQVVAMFAAKHEHGLWNLYYYDEGKSWSWNGLETFKYAGGSKRSFNTFDYCFNQTDQLLYLPVDYMVHDSSISRQIWSLIALVLSVHQELLVWK